MAMIMSFRETQPRYPLLRIAGLMCVLFGSLLVLLGIGLLGSAILMVVAERGGPIAAPGLFVWAYAIYGVGFLFGALQMFVVAGVLQLMIHLEENTRATAQAVDTIRSRLEPKPEGVEPFFAA